MDRNPTESDDCAENCVCQPGLLLDGDKCIPEDQCGCQKDGLYYLVCNHCCNNGPVFVYGLLVLILSGVT